jgi:Tol biopolymer transport system component
MIWHYEDNEEPEGGGVVQTLVEGGDNFEPAVSPDSKLLAYVHSERGTRQVWVRDLETRVSRRITNGACSNDWPAWDLGSRSIVFASDCMGCRGYTECECGEAAEGQVGDLQT